MSGNRARAATVSAPGVIETIAAGTTHDMPFRLRPRPSSVLASLAAAGLVLTGAGCASHLTPLGPNTAPQPHHLRSPIVLQAMRIQPATPAGRCPAGTIAPSGGSAPCYRKLGTPVTITSAAVSAATLSPAQPKTTSGQVAGPSAYGFMIALPVADAAALTTVTTTASDAHGYLALSVAGRTWVLPRVLRPFTRPQFQIILPSNQAHQFQHLLAPSG